MFNQKYFVVQSIQYTTFLKERNVIHDVCKINRLQVKILKHFMCVRSCWNIGRHTFSALELYPFQSQIVVILHTFEVLQTA